MNCWYYWSRPRQFVKMVVGVYQGINDIQHDGGDDVRPQSMYILYNAHRFASTNK